MKKKVTLSLLVGVIAAVTIFGAVESYSKGPALEVDIEFSYIKKHADGSATQYLRAKAAGGSPGLTFKWYNTTSIMSGPDVNPNEALVTYRRGEVVYVVLIVSDKEGNQVRKKFKVPQQTLSTP